MADRIKYYGEACSERIKEVISIHFTLDINVIPKYRDFCYYKGNELKYCCFIDMHSLKTCVQNIP
jgi:hypothetical protein